jgi:hypothetical protein
MNSTVDEKCYNITFINEGYKGEDWSDAPFGQFNRGESDAPDYIEMAGHNIRTIVGTHADQIAGSVA